VPSPAPVTPPTRLTPENLFLGVGSDECIDALLRAFCVPGKEAILTCPPTYGMYSVSAQVNDVAVVPHPLTTEFDVDTEGISEILAGPKGKEIKLVYICSPGNPTGKLVDPRAVKKLLEHPTWNGVIIVDEAYVDFSPEGASLAPWVTAFPNLVVMQTLSKAFGLAAIRLGAAFTSPEIARILNSLKAPYSISSPTSALALAALGEEGLRVKDEKVSRIVAERKRLVKELPTIEGVGKFLGGEDANFLLVEILDKTGAPSNEVALRVYEQLAETRGVVVRFRGKERGCFGCLRMTVGTEKENSLLLERLREVLAETRK
jgi:histidinol-phosphate aminotransferase